MSAKYKIYDAEGNLINKIKATDIAPFVPEGGWYEQIDTSAAELVSQKSKALAEIASVCAEIRSKFVTPLPGQEMIYLKKEAEAKEYLADENPDITQYPLIAAEIGITGETADQVAQVYVNMGAMWTQAGAALETIRLGYLTQVEQATDLATITTLTSDFETAIANYKEEFGL